MCWATARLATICSVFAALAFGCPRTGEGPAQPEEKPPEAAGWDRPFSDEFGEPPPMGAVGMYAMVGDRVGPLYPDTPAELEFLQRIFTDWEVRGAIERNERTRAERVFEVYDRDTRLLVVEPDEGASGGGDATGAGDEVAEIGRVRVESARFRSTAGVGVGDVFEVIARAHGPLECRAGEGPEGGEQVAICRERDEGSALRWIFPHPAGAMAEDWLSPAASAELLEGARAAEVWWRPPD